MGSNSRKSDAKRRGDLLEDISAWLHDEPGVSVQKRVRLRTPDKRTREIDVLLSRHLAGYPVRIAIECKNQRQPVGSPTVDSFIGKLQDIGIPVCHGFLISVSGYTKHAAKRAAQVDLRTLELKGLSKDGLKLLVSECLQSIVYLMASVEDLSIATRINDFDLPYNVNAFYSAEEFESIWEGFV